MAQCRRRGKPRTSSRGRIRRGRPHGNRALIANIPDGVEDFIAWFEGLRRVGRDRATSCFVVGHSASREQMKWFIEQEVAGEAGFDDLLASPR
jgi:hypothetical protein